jgi:LacI family transcriptional regulator, galactose operon repressor
VNDRARERRGAYERVLEEHALPVDSALVQECDFDFKAGRCAMQKLLQSGRRPTAVFCANDIQAIGAMSKCRDVGIRIPADLSIIGFDDLPIAEFVDPQLTTVRVPASEMGRLAARTVLQHLTQGKPLQPVVLTTGLVIRASAGPANPICN